MPRENQLGPLSKASSNSRFDRPELRVLSPCSRRDLGTDGNRMRGCRGGPRGSPRFHSVADKGAHGVPAAMRGHAPPGAVPPGSPGTVRDLRCVPGRSGEPLSRTLEPGALHGAASDAPMRLRIFSVLNAGFSAGSPLETPPRVALLGTRQYHFSEIDGICLLFYTFYFLYNLILSERHGV